MASETEIANLALGHLGISKTIATMTENSQEARACNRFYPFAREEVLRDFMWPFATKYFTLGLVEEDPTEEWAYSYRYPSDCLFFRRILSGNRDDNQDTKVPYIVASDDTGRLIYTDQDEAECEYTANITDAGKFTADFVFALSTKLAVFIAPQLTAGDPFKLGDKALNLHTFEISKAHASSVNEESRSNREPESEFIRGRE